MRRLIALMFLFQLSLTLFIVDLSTLISGDISFKTVRNSNAPTFLRLGWDMTDDDIYAFFVADAIQ